MQTVEIIKDLFWTGVRDRSLRKFDIIMETEFGTTYNSYLLKGRDKTVLFETAKFAFWEAYRKELEELTDIKQIDYIVVNHTEPDHAGSVEHLIDLNPNIKIVGSPTAIRFLKHIVNREFYSIPIKDNDRISLGDKTLQFFILPNLHWPDTMYTYLAEEKVLFTCDSFGSHYCFDGVFVSEVKEEEKYLRALQYYFDHIIGPFKPYMRKALQKIEPLEVKMICTGHGPVLDERIEEIKELYRRWSADQNPNTKPTVVMPYVSAYGYTKELGEEIARGIRESGEIEVRMFNMEEETAGMVLEELSFADGILFGTPTIVGEALKPIWDLTTSMFAGAYKGRLASAYGSFGWSGEGVPHILERLRQLKMKVTEGYCVQFKPGTNDKIEAYDYGFQFGCTLLNQENPRKKQTKKGLVKCLVCGEIFEEGIEICPVCGVGPENFVPVEQKDTGFTKPTNEKFLILGNGAAGLTAAEEIRKRNETASIVMVTNEPYLSYNRPMLTKSLMADYEAAQIEIHHGDWYEKNRILNLTEKELDYLDSSKKEAVFKDGVRLSYDKCIYALGAECNIPSIAGSEQSHVVAIRRISDVQKVQELLKEASHAVVIGGGVLGLEAACEIRKAGVQVQVVEVAKRLMPRQLDENGSAMLERILNEKGIVFHKEAQAESFEEKEVLLKDGSRLRADLVIISAGVTPCAGAAEKSGIEVERGVLVNGRMETNLPDVYACGDCAQFEGMNYANWPQALAMGKIAGANAAGEALLYEQIFPALTFHGGETSLYSIGDNGTKEKEFYKTAEFTDEQKHIYEKYYFQNNRLCGVILLGDTSKIAKVNTAVQEHWGYKETFKSLSL